MQLRLDSSLRKDTVARALNASLATKQDTIEEAVVELRLQYQLALATFVSLADKREIVTNIVGSSLPSNLQSQISDESVGAVFLDLVRNALVEIDVEWFVPTPPPIPEPPPPPPPFNPNAPPPDPQTIWPFPPPNVVVRAPTDPRDIWPEPQNHTASPDERQI